MYHDIMSNLEKRLSPDEFNSIKNRRIHLGIFTEPYLTYMLEGKKTIESRFSKHKIAPYKQITKDDIVIVKKSGGNVIAYFTMKEVLCFDLSITPINEIKSKYGSALCVDQQFWESKKDSCYATLLTIDKIRELKPFSIKKKGMQTWIVL